jgi:hypothetical protein
VENKESNPTDRVVLGSCGLQGMCYQLFKFLYFKPSKLENGNYRHNLARGRDRPSNYFFVSLFSFSLGVKVYPSQVQTGSSLGVATTNAVLCKTCCVLLCVLVQPGVDNSARVPLRAGPNWKQSVQLA